jgi:hypothetical protein
MASEKSHEPKKPEGPEPFITQEDRPDLTIDLNKKVQELTVRELKTLLGGGSSSAAKLKEALIEKNIPDKSPTKDAKDGKENKDRKEPKDTKDNKDSKDPKDHKEPKDTKDNKEHKDPKDSKDNKDNKDNKDHKDSKDNKDNKEHKEPKESKDSKDTRDIKGDLIDKAHKDSFETLPQFVHDQHLVKSPDEGSSGNPLPPTGLEGLIERVTGLEKEVRHLKGIGGGDGGKAK